MYVMLLLDMNCRPCWRAGMVITMFTYAKAKVTNLVCQAHVQHSCYAHMVEALYRDWLHAASKYLYNACKGSKQMYTSVPVEGCQRHVPLATCSWACIVEVCACKIAL